MDNNIFRKKNLDKMQSPDNLNEYIKVINPGLWIVFIAAFILLAGAFVWGSVGKIDDKLSVTVVSQNGVISCDYNDAIEVGMKVVVNGHEGSVSSVNPFGTTLTFDTVLPNGQYSGYVVIGQISPISFVFN